MAKKLYLRFFSQWRQLTEYVNTANDNGTPLPQEDVFQVVTDKSISPSFVLLFWWDPESHDNAEPPPAPGIKDLSSNV